MVCVFVLPAQRRTWKNNNWRSCHICCHVCFAACPEQPLRQQFTCSFEASHPLHKTGANGRRYEMTDFSKHASLWLSLLITKRSSTISPSPNAHIQMDHLLDCFHKIAKWRCTHPKRLTAWHSSQTPWDFTFGQYPIDIAGRTRSFVFLPLPHGQSVSTSHNMKRCELSNKVCFTLAMCAEPLCEIEIHSRHNIDDSSIARHDKRVGHSQADNLSTRCRQAHVYVCFQQSCDDWNVEITMILIAFAEESSAFSVLLALCTGALRLLSSLFEAHSTTHMKQWLWHFPWNIQPLGSANQKQWCLLSLFADGIFLVLHKQHLS